MIRLFNTLTKKKEDFKPIKNNFVGMYHCGPTVYNYAHIGNLRAYVFADTLRRNFEWNGFEVKQVINITDVGHLVGDADSGEDKMEKGAVREGVSAQEIAQRYTEAFLNDLKDLHINTSETLFPKATQHIKEQTELIKKLERNGYTYKITDGIYFDTSKFKEYGKLGNIDIEGLREGARIEKNSEKRNITDFALWKFHTGKGKREQEWESPWGIGFPGWHIECSAMSMKYLGETFDIHTGGIDHVGTHHNGEIAQSEAANGKPQANYWMHVAFVNVEGGKMAKSGNNFIRLETLKDKGFDPIAYRYWLLMGHYRTQMNFTFEALEGAKNALKNLSNSVIKLSKEKGKISTSYVEKLKEAMNDDLDTPKAIALLWELIKDQSVTNGDKKTTIEEFDKVLGLNIFELSKKLEEKNTSETPDEIKDLLTQRNQAREEKNWKKADELREKIKKLGYGISDDDGTSKVFKL